MWGGMDGVGVEVNLALDAVRLSRCCVEAGTCTRHGDAPHLARFVLGLVQLLLIAFSLRFASPIAHIGSLYSAKDMQQYVVF